MKFFYINKVINKIRYIFAYGIYVKLRVLKYKLFSNTLNVEGKSILHQPLLLKGLGKIIFGKNVHIGVTASPYFFNTYAFFEVRDKESRISIEDNVYFNNNACLISDGAGITIRKNTIIGPNLMIFDSDFHDLEPMYRMNGVPKKRAVEIEENVFIGSNVIILKGVTIGANSVIGSGSIVSKSIPPNVIAAGNPCVIIKNLVL